MLKSAACSLICLFLLTSPASAQKVTGKLKPLFGAAMKQYQQTLALKAELSQPLKPNERIKKQKELEDVTPKFLETARSAAALVDARTDPKVARTVRYLFADALLKNERFFEAGIVAENLAATLDIIPRPKKDKDGKITQDAKDAAKEEAAEASQLAISAAVMAIRAYSMALGEAQKAKQDDAFEVSLLQRGCRLMIRRFPTQIQTSSARLTLARLYAQEKKYLIAAQMFSSIPKEAEHYREGQLQSGQFYAFIAQKPELLDLAKTATDDQIKLRQAQYRSMAKQRLTTGIAMALEDAKQDQQQDPKKQLPAPPLMVVNAKISLVEIALREKQHAVVLGLLQREPWSVLKQIDEKDPKQKTVASRVYRHMLRAYIGQKNIKKARETMEKLEEIGGFEPDVLTAIYVNIGNDLKTDVLAAPKNQQKQTIEALVSLVDEISKRKEGKTLGIHKWIAIAYNTVGDLVEDPKEKQKHYEVATKRLQELLDRGKKEKDFLPAKEVPSIKAFQASIKMKHGKYDDAIRLYAEILATNERLSAFQKLAAVALQKKADAARDAKEKSAADAYKNALGGPKITVSTDAGQKVIDLWGWRDLRKKSKNQLAKTKSRGGETLLGWAEVAIGTPRERSGKKKASAASIKRWEDSFFGACLEGDRCRFEYGKLQKSKADVNKFCEASRKSMRILRDSGIRIPDDWKKKFNGLYDEITTVIKPADKARLFPEFPSETKPKPDPPKKPDPKQPAKTDGKKPTPMPGKPPVKKPPVKKPGTPGLSEKK